MERSAFHHVCYIHRRIKEVEENSKKLLSMRSQIREILTDFPQIPEEEIFEVCHQIYKLNKYIEEGIEKAYKQIDEL